MVDIPLGRADYHRSVAKEAQIQTRNRFFEQNPVLASGQAALISRPGLKRWIYVGDGPIRALFSASGDFDDALFVVSGTEWYRVDLDGTTTLLQGGLNPVGTPRMAATGTIGDGTSATPAYLYLADGVELYLYIENSFATGTITGSPANGNTITLGDFHYQFTNASVDTGTPDGSGANPWLVALSTSDLLAWTNFANAVNISGAPGTDYSTATTSNTLAQSTNKSTDTVSVRANTAGALGNDVGTAATGGLAWGAANLVNGGQPQVTAVELPNDVGAVSVCYQASYIIVVPAQVDDFKGRFYWIDPGETTIDPLDFATAEREPDAVYDAIAFQDQFWLPGATTTEVWYFTGNSDSPVQRLQGVAFNRGTWQGTALQVKESMIIVDSDGGVFQIAGGLTRISNPAVEERIRVAINTQAFKNA